MVRRLAWWALVAAVVGAVVIGVVTSRRVEPPLIEPQPTPTEGHFVAFGIPEVASPPADHEAPTPLAEPKATPAPPPPALSDATVASVLDTLEVLLRIADEPLAYDAWRSSFPEAVCGVPPDIKRRGGPAAKPCYECALTTDGAHGFYEFFPDEVGQAATLQQVVVTLPWFLGSPPHIVSVERGNPDAHGLPSDASERLQIGIDSAIDRRVGHADDVVLDDIDYWHGAQPAASRRVFHEVLADLWYERSNWVQLRRREGPSDVFVRFWRVADGNEAQARCGLLWRRAPLRDLHEAYLDRHLSGDAERSRSEVLNRRLLERSSEVSTLDAVTACAEAGVELCEEGREAISSMDSQLLASFLDGALAKLQRTATKDPCYPPLAYWVDRLAAARGYAVEHDARVEWRLSLEEFRQASGDLAERGLRWENTWCGGEEWELHRTLLKALATDHLDSPWGELAFLEMTRRGWRLTADPNEIGDEFRPVIARGEEFLREHASSAVAQEVMLEVARAYETWWSLSVSSLEGWTNPENYREDADRARTEAIRVYRSYLEQRTGLPRVDRMSILGTLFRLDSKLDTGQSRYFGLCD